MSDNLYTTPESELENNQGAPDAVLASRWSRLGASIIDGLIMALAIVPITLLIGGLGALSGEEPLSFGVNIILGLLSIVVFVGINYKLLVSKGQTIGKKLVNIKIVDMNGEKPDFNDHLVKRYAVYFLPSQVPIIGGLFQLVNILFIFRGDKRCIHDLAGNTQVVNN